MQSDTLFKIFASTGITAEILFLGGILVWAFEEYQPSQAETIGITMIGITLSVALGALVYSLLSILRFKSTTE